MKTSWTGMVLALAALASGAAAAEERKQNSWSAVSDGRTVQIGENGKPVLVYQLVRPADSKLPVEGACYFHPVMTPAGTVVTDVAPKDHPHHRGIFLAWVETHGAKDADFWGWGEHAPVKGRRIVHGNNISARSSQNAAGFDVRNEWLADGEPLIHETLSAWVRPEPSAHAYVIDLDYHLTPTADMTLSRWAFSGFCVRTRGDGKVTAFGPQGEVTLPNPSHLKPESDWPNAPWYDYTLKFDDGKVAGVAVMNHPQNPPTLWHNHRDIRMLNPCIVAPAEVKLKANQPLVLRYRVVAHDGAVPTEALKKLATEWGTADDKATR